MKRGFQSILFGVLLVLPPIIARADLKLDVGYTELSAGLGNAMPDGSGVKVTQVEAPLIGTTNAYMPDTVNAQFAGKTITDKTGGGVTSWHATTVGTYFYGSTTSLSPGITTIDVYEANNFLGSGLLRSGTTSSPIVETSDIQNHSWVGTTGVAATDQDILRRLDYMIDRDNVLVVAGLNNGAATQVPNLLAGAYNGITVGRSDGDHSTGTTQIDGTGRVRPDIVAPTGASSWATPVVASAGAVLIETASSLVSADADKTQVIKAVLLAGASKTGEEFSASWDRTNTRPLDEHYGAGEVDILNSHGIMATEEQEASASTNLGLLGWAFEQVANDSLIYFFEVPAGNVLTELSAILTWNRIITNGLSGPNFGNLQSSMANLDLRFYAASNFTLGGQLDFSVSDVDNVEHIYQTNLGAGQYALVVEKRNSSQPNTDYALAWRVSTVPEPGSFALVFFGLVSLAVLGRRAAGWQ